MSTSSPLTLDYHIDKSSIMKSSRLSHTSGPFLSKCIELTSNKTDAAFFVDNKNRHIAEQNCYLYIKRFLSELDRCFAISEMQENLRCSVNPVYLYKNEQAVCQTSYGHKRLALAKNIIHFIISLHIVSTEWESLSPSLISYIAGEGKQHSRKLFWKEFLLLQQSLNFNFDSNYKNITLLVKIYWVSPTNSAACEGVYSISNCI